MEYIDEIDIPEFRREIPTYRANGTVCIPEKRSYLQSIWGFHADQTGKEMKRESFERYKL